MNKQGTARIVQGHYFIPYRVPVVHLHHFTVHEQAVQCLPLFQFIVTWGPHIVIQCTAVNVTSIINYLNNTLEIFSFSLQTCITCNKYIIHCITFL